MSHLSWSDETRHPPAKARRTSQTRPNFNKARTPTCALGSKKKKFENWEAALRFPRVQTLLNDSRSEGTCIVSILSCCRTGFITPSYHYFFVGSMHFSCLPTFPFLSHTSRLTNAGKFQSFFLNFSTFLLSSVSFEGHAASRCPRPAFFPQIEPGRSLFALLRFKWFFLNV